MMPATLDELVAQIAAIDDPAERRAARLALKERAILLKRQIRRLQSVGRLFDAFQKFGGGSLLTSTVLLVIGGRAGNVILAIAGFTLLLFVAGVTLMLQVDSRIAELELALDGIDAVLQELGR